MEEPLKAIGTDFCSDVFSSFLPNSSSIRRLTPMSLETNCSL